MLGVWPAAEDAEVARVLKLLGGWLAAGDATLEMEGLEGAVNGLNGLQRPGYFGPRPPANGQLHAYHFRVYALDDALNLEPGLGKAELLDAMNGHVLATGMLMGHYERKE